MRLTARLGLGVLTTAILATACTGTADPTTTTEPDTPSSTSSTTTTAPSVPLPTENQTRARIDPPPGWEITADRTASDELFLSSLLSWLDDDLVRESVEFGATSDEGRIVGISVDPPLGIRGYPLLVDLVLEAADVPITAEGPTDVVTVAVQDVSVSLWSDGDGLLVTASSDGSGEAFLEAVAAAHLDNAIWAVGTCLELDQSELYEYGTLPWAPVVTDIVVSCDDIHHAEVIYSDPAGVDAPEYDEEAISYDRAYVCDQAYNEAIGRQSDHTATLITYAPDGDEWARGDRYLACVIVVPNADGGEMPYVGRITERDDIVFGPEPGTCLVATFRVITDCDIRHHYEVVGSVEMEGTDYPTTEAFDVACEPLLAELEDRAEAEIVALADRIGRWAWDQGERTLRCVAAAQGGDGLVPVRGSFFGSWAVVTDDGIAA